MAPWMIMAGFRTTPPKLKAQIPQQREPTLPKNSSSKNSQRVQFDLTTTSEESSDEFTRDESEHTEENTPIEFTTRSGRVSRPPDRLHMVAHQATHDESESPEDDDYYDVLHQEDYSLQDEMNDPIAFKASTDPDTMYYHQAMQAADSEAFLQAIVKEINDHIEGNHWGLIPSSSVPQGAKILDSVWAMKRKRDIKTQQVYKHKARLNIHGGQQEYGTHYTDTFSPVVHWFSVRLLLVMAKLHGYYTRQVDFVLAYPQADLPFENYMKLPHGIKTAEGSRESHVLKLKKNIYGGRNSGRIWYDYLKDGLINIGFTVSAIDECVFYRKDVIFFFYVDDGIWISKTEKGIDKAIKDLMNLKKAKKKYTIDDQGDISDYLGINFV